MDEFSIYREQALRLRKLAESGTEGELRAELRQLAAGLASWIVRAEIRAMSEAPEAPRRGRRWRVLARWWWRHWGRGWDYAEWGSAAAQ